MNKILSANIRFDNDKDNDKGHPWSERKHLLKEIVHDHSPLLLCTQEGREKQIRELAALIPQYTLLEHHRLWIAERMYPNIFYDPRFILPLASGDLWLSQTPHVPGSVSFNSRFPRLCIWFKAVFLPRQMPFLLANTHLDHEYPEVRHQQIKVFLQEIQYLLLTHPQWPLLICGDFNEGPQENVMREIFQQMPQIIDPWQSLNLRERPSFHKFEFSYLDAKRIDWILLDKRLQPHKIFFEERHTNGLFPSDHYPVVCEFIL